ncbi:MAG: hypothetical protein LBL90_02450 [Prevotellaceae bacterium]|jgi:hypothetical protein|nr:hypothetical protein [Prevotellaceae bacterium]
MKNLIRSLKHVAYLFVILLIVDSTALLAQGQFTSQGTDFRIAFGSNPNTGGVFQIRMVATEASVVTVTYRIDNTSTIYNLAAGEVRTISLNKTKLEHTGTGVTNKSLRVQSDKNIALFAIDMAVYITDATNVLPVTNYGTEYRHISYKNANDNGARYGDGYFVIAHQNNTIVYHAGTSVATLSEGQVYFRYSGQTGDFTGTKVTTSQPAAYGVYNDCVKIPASVYACDCLFQQLPPIPAWGNNFLVPVTNRGKDRVRIVAAHNGTIITQTGGAIQAVTGGQSTLSLNEGQFVELEISSSANGCYISASKPVAVAAFLMGSQNFSLAENVRGDPAMAWVPPIEQHVAHTAIAPFVAAGNSVIAVHYALIIAPTAFKNTTTVAIGTGPEAGLSGGSWVDNIASGYSYYSMPLSNSVQTYTYKNPNGLMIMGYGLGRDESYYYMAAASARQLDPAYYINEIHFQDANGQTYCDDDFVFRASIQYPVSMLSGALRWYIDEVEWVDAKDLYTWTLPKGELLGQPQPHTIRLHITDSYNMTKDVITSFTVLPTPTAIPASDLSAMAVCSGIAPTITVANTQIGFTYDVYTNSTGTTKVGSASGTGGTVNITCSNTISSNTTFYVEKHNGVCGSTRTPITVTVVGRPYVPTVTAAAICNGSNPVISLASSVLGVDYNVYTSNSGGILVGSVTGNGAPRTITLSTTPASNTTYWVEATVGSCASTSRTSVTVSVNALPALASGNVTQVNVLCHGESTGSITVTSGYASYSIDNGANWQASNVFSGLPAETYYIKVKNAAGCESGSVTVNITQPTTALSFTKSYVDVLCYGESTGSITVTASGGTGTKQYSKNDGVDWQMSNVFNNLPAGTYQIKVKDVNGCVTTAQSVSISQSASALSFSTAKTHVLCYDESTGSITVTASGGTGTKQYSKNDGIDWQPSNVFSGLHAGIYKIKVKDANGCITAMEQVTITQSTEITASAAVTDLTCNQGENNGSIVITASGGVGPYEYSIGGITYQSSNSFTNLSIGTYALFVRDANWCEVSVGSYVVSQPLAISLPATFATTFVSCNSGNDGSITVNGVSGGTAPYLYSFDSGIYQSSNSQTGLSAGDHTVQVRDNNGCVSAIKTVTISEPPVLLILGDVSAPVACYNSAATVVIANSVSGVVYKVYDEQVIGIGNLLSSGTGNNGTLTINVGIYEKTTTLYVETQDGICISASRIPVDITVRRPILYPDIRIIACPQNTINLTKYIDTTYFVSANWTPASAFNNGGINNGTIVDASKLLPGNTYIYKYEATNLCDNDGSGNLYMTIIDNKDIRVFVDTVWICKDENSIHLNKIFGVEAEVEEWSAIPVSASNHLSVLTTPLPQAGATFFDVQAAWSDASIPINGEGNKEIKITLKTASASCLEGRVFEIVIVITSL